MQTIDLRPGTTIEHAAAMLVERAPARADFNGIELSAEHGMTAGDIVAGYDRAWRERSDAFWASTEGKAERARQEESRAEAQSKVDWGMALLPSVNFDDSASVLGWVETMAAPCDHVGVAFDRRALRSAFAAGGWGVGVNCGEDFDGSDPRNFAGWIVGQWLHIFHEGLTVRFIGEWRDRFGAS